MIKFLKLKIRIPVCRQAGIYKIKNCLPAGEAGKLKITTRAFGYSRSSFLFAVFSGYFS